MKLRLVFAMLVVALLTACGHTDPVVRYKNIAGLPPDALLQDCPVTAPPSRQNYLAQDWTAREKLLADTNTAQYSNISLCNTDKAGLRAWKIKQQKLIEQEEAK